MDLLANASHWCLEHGNFFYTQSGQHTLPMLHMLTYQRSLKLGLAVRFTEISFPIAGFALYELPPEAGEIATVLARCCIPHVFGGQVSLRRFVYIYILYIHIIMYTHYHTDAYYVSLTSMKHHVPRPDWTFVWKSPEAAYGMLGWKPMILCDENYSVFWWMGRSLHICVQYMIVHTYSPEN